MSRITHNGVRYTFDHGKFHFVFGSNLAGRHGRGAARDARLYFGAINGHGEGHQGQSYALPTKDHNLKTLPLREIKKHALQFLQHADRTPEIQYMLTRIGCGLAGFDDSEIAPLFANVPKNVWLPRSWQRIIAPDNEFRLIIAGSRAFTNFGQLANTVDKLLTDKSKTNQIVVVSGRAKGADLLGEQYARKRSGFLIDRWPANWTKFLKPAGYLRNFAMAWWSDAAVIFRVDKSVGSTRMAEIALREGLQTRLIEITKQASN